MTLQIGCLHKETITFLVLEGPTVDIFLECPWLNQHSPYVRWDPCEITHWSKACHQNCLSAVPKPPTAPDGSQICSTLIKSPEPQDVPSIPSDYVAFQDVFSKQAATRLPPHWPWDCAIDLLPGATLPKGRVYPLSIPERKAMVEYIQEALQQGFIQPSTLPNFSSWVKMMEAWGPASITEPWIRRWWNCRTHFPWSRQLWRKSVELAVSPSWTCRARTTLFASGKLTSGRRLSSLSLGTMNIGWCCMA